MFLARQLVHHHILFPQRVIVLSHPQPAFNIVVLDGLIDTRIDPSQFQKSFASFPVWWLSVDTNARCRAVVLLCLRNFHSVVLIWNRWVYEKKQSQTERQNEEQRLLWVAGFSRVQGDDIFVVSFQDFKKPPVFKEVTRRKHSPFHSNVSVGYVHGQGIFTEQQEPEMWNRWVIIFQVPHSCHVDDVPTKNVGWESADNSPKRNICIDRHDRETKRRPMSLWRRFFCPVMVPLTWWHKKHSPTRTIQWGVSGDSKALVDVVVDIE